LSPARLQIPHALSFFTFGGVRRANGGGIEKAKVVLDEAAKLFPDDGMIQYNLACYCAQLGQLDAAKEHLDKSYELGDAKQIKLIALDDEDLKPLWEAG
jgi:tetratricopeptide (TPR) repeat protein